MSSNDQAAEFIKLLIKQNETDFTKTIHREPYPSISVTRPELSHAGKTVLVTGGGTSIGLSIAKSFLRAGASTIVITGRRLEVLEASVEKLKAEAAKIGVEAVVLARKNDVADHAAVKALWSGLEAEGIVVDVLVSNAGDFVGGKTILDVGSDRLWQAFETNVRGPLDMVENFAKQPGNRPKAVVVVATQGINMLYEEQLVVTSQNPGYSMTKNSGALLMQLIAKDSSPENLQIVSFHPGVIYNETFLTIGFSETDLPYDDPELPGSFAVWAASKEARFLHGRFVWASWDVDELATGELRKRIDDNVDFLRIGVVGLHGARKD
ncbi:putative short-chain dehydrogenase [Dactylonectria estremocensis]|uniref:Short-chain dehydrogenase n=1 Tax=Dactylonectria estremocensis TaxID=1079267 RepID=A0A9P9IH23_9HYPO|nr:putative short-chain dehydrogenase [Dactylonectria estremocensis]